MPNVLSSAGRAYGGPGGSPRADAANYTTSAAGGGRDILARLLAGAGAQPPPIPQELLNPAQPPPIPQDQLNPAAQQQPPPISPEMLGADFPNGVPAAGTPFPAAAPAQPPPIPPEMLGAASASPPPAAATAPAPAPELSAAPVLPDLSRNPYELERGARKPVIRPGRDSGSSPLGADKSPLRRKPKKKGQYKLRIEQGD